MKVWIVLLAAILVSSNLYWVARFLDAGTSYVQTKQSNRVQEKSLELAIELANLNLIGMVAEEARLQITQAQPDVLIDEHIDGCLYIENICVYTDAFGVVTEIRQ